MRVGTTLSYLFGAHLHPVGCASRGSKSITTDASGNVSGELRYLPFGETRYLCAEVRDYVRAGFWITTKIRIILSERRVPRG